MAVSRRTVVGAGAWTLGGHVVVQALRFAGNLLLARLLLPEAFGVMAVAAVVLVAFGMLTDLGLQQGVIRSANSDSAEYLDTVWVLQIAQGAIILAFSCGAAGILLLLQVKGQFPPGSAYAHPELPLAVVGLATGFLVQSLASTKWAAATKRLEIGRLVLIEISCQALAVIVMIAWARVDPSLRALIAGALASAACRTIASHAFLSGARNTFRFSRQAGGEVLAFGRWVFVSSFATFLVSNLDKVLLAWLIPAEQFGFYSVASLMIFAVHEIVNRLATRVGYPALSAVYRTNPSALAATYYRARLPSDAFCLVLAGILVVCSDEIVGMLYPATYSDAGTYLSVLAISLIGVRFIFLPQIYMALGRSRLLLVEQGVRLVVLSVGIVLGFRFFGIHGAVWAVSASYVAAGFTSALWVGRRLGVWNGAREWLGVPLFAAGLVSGLILQWIFRTSLSP
jgi:O-antigen/teichoic acid export membrane protein